MADVSSAKPRFAEGVVHDDIVARRGHGPDVFSQHAQLRRAHLLHSGIGRREAAFGEPPIRRFGGAEQIDEVSARPYSRIIRVAAVRSLLVISIGTTEDAAGLRDRLELGELG